MHSAISSKGSQLVRIVVPCALCTNEGGHRARDAFSNEQRKAPRVLRDLACSAGHRASRGEFYSLSCLSV
jgi:hypothetical protein